MWRRTFSVIVVGVALIALGACAGGGEEPMVSESETATAAPTPPIERPAPAPPTAVATLEPAEGMVVAGTVTFTQEEDGVHVVADIAGASPGMHGFHLHETGDCSAADFSSAGGHFNPDGVDHGCPDSEVHHAGDFGNVDVGEDGTGRLDLVSPELTVDAGEYSVVGKAVILHAGQDDCTTQPSGDSGARIACGVVEQAGKAEMGGETMGEESMGGEDMSGQDMGGDDMGADQGMQDEGGGSDG